MSGKAADHRIEMATIEGQAFGCGFDRRDIADISLGGFPDNGSDHLARQVAGNDLRGMRRSEEHTSELQSLMRISYAVFCLQHTPNMTTSPFQHRTLTTNI